MPFVSVVDSAQKESRTLFSFSDAVLHGWAPDGGMFWPLQIPRLDHEVLREWSQLPFPALCAEVVKVFAEDDPELSPEVIDAICATAFSRFGIKEVINVQPLPAASPEAHVHDNFYVSELWHGPTLAFKDLGMAVLARVLDHLLKVRGKTQTLLVGTSGDTGSAAMEAVRGLERLRLLVLYPLQGFSAITPTQEAQMAVVAEAERHIDLVGVEGSSDDLDVPIEACFADENFVAQHGLGTANSVNIVRLIVQAANFVYSYFRGTNNWFVLKIVFDCLQAILTSLFIDHIRPLLHRDSETYLQVGEEPATPSPLQPALFAVPCGAAGNLASGLLAAQLGLPLKFIAATNSNDALHRVLSGNMLRRMDTTRTVSPSMDIQVPYNLWRIVFLASGGDALIVRKCLQSLKDDSLVLPPAIVESIGKWVQSASVSDASSLETIATYFDRGYMLDPHTAVAVAGALQCQGEQTSQTEDDPKASRSNVRPVICMASAHPVKFCSAVSSALGRPCDAALLAIVPDAKHPCVQRVAQLNAELHANTTPAPSALPRGCCAVLKREDQERWTQQLQDIINDMPALPVALGDVQTTASPES